MDKDKLISKYLNGDLTPEEWQELERWLDASDINHITFNKLESYYKNDEKDIHAKKALVWDEISSKIAADEQAKLSEGRSRSNTLTFFMKVAAVLLLIGGASVLVVNFSDEASDRVPSIQMVESVALPGQKITKLLPDGSVVILNAGSKIVFPENFQQDKREIELSGEAFFEVKHDPSRPFLVSCKGAVVKVLGTSFNVRTYPEEESISVAVATGRVLFSGPEKDTEVVLQPDEMAIYDEKKKQVIRSQVDELMVFGWKDKILYFEEEEFDKIIKELERWYGVEIETEQDFSKMGKFSGEFKNKSLEHVLIGLAYLYEFDYEIEKNIVKLK